MKLRKFLAAVASLLALTAVAWTVGDWYVQRQENARRTAELEQAVANLDPEQLAHQRNLAKWYNYQLDRGMAVPRDAYRGILDLSDGAMALLEVPELGLTLPVFHGTQGPVGHDPASHLPVGGRGSHTVLILDAHYQWAAGQQIRLNCLGKQLTYRVESVQVMPYPWPTERPAEDGQELLTLVYDRGNTRTIVRCVHCAELLLGDAEQGSPGMAALAAAAPAGLILPAVWRKKRYAMGVQRL